MTIAATGAAPTRRRSPPGRRPHLVDPPAAGPAHRADRGRHRLGTRHTVYLKTVDPNRRTIRFDLIQFYGGDEALREAAKDHPEASPDEVRRWVPNDFYIRNVNPKLRTLPVPADAAITVITLAWGEGPADSQRIVPVSSPTLRPTCPRVSGHSRSRCGTARW
jgi:hypothetical protein